MCRPILVSLAFILLVARVVSAQTTGSISGTMTLFEAAFDLRPSIEIFDATGVPVAVVGLGGPPSVMSPSTDSVPWYSGALVPGTYYLRTSSGVMVPTINQAYSSGVWVDQVYGGGPCVAADCNPLAGIPVKVVAGQTTSGVNFTLDLGASISGNGPTTFSLGAPAYDIYDSRGVRLPSRVVVFQNGYVAKGLPAGTYYLLAHRASDGSAPETLYPNSPCDGCAVTSGTPVTVVLGENKTGIDFGTSASGTIGGTVRSDGSANPPNTALVGAIVTVYAPNGAKIAEATTAADGTYSIGALAPGSYYVSTSPQPGDVGQIYAGIACSGCDPTKGTAVTVTAGGTTTGIDFLLAQGTAVSGLDPAVLPGFPAVYGSIVFYTSSPDSPAARALAASVPNTPGFGTTVRYGATLPQGTYFVQTDPLAGYIQQIYPGIACPQGRCPTASATPVTVAATAVTAIDFNPPTCTPPIIAPVSLARAAVGVSYRQTLLASGANGVVSFVVSSGTLPPGLTFDANSGVLSGTPTMAGHFTFTVSAVDSIACAGSRTYTLDVPQCAFNLVNPFSALSAAGVADGVIIVNWCGNGFTATSSAPLWLSVVRIMYPSPVFDSLPWVVFSVGANPGPPRQGTIVIGPRVATIFQSGAAPSPAFGSVDAPADGSVVSGSIGISGWALTEAGEPIVSIYRDPVAGEPAQPIFIGNATFVDGARPDVSAAYPTFPFNSRAGWGYLLLTNGLPNQGNGTFRFRIYAEDANGTTLIGTKVINAVNATATAPFGAIDTPGQGGFASGSVFVNFGWALTPQPKTIPFDGSTINVLIDGVPVGPVTAYNFFRSDVSTLFPGLKNSGGPVGYRIIDTTALSEGLHTIAWLATDDGGVTMGIGSRFFTVQNSAWQPSLRANFAVTPPTLTDSELAHADSTTAVPPRVNGVDLGRQVDSLASVPLDATGARTVAITNLQVLQLSLKAGSSKDPADDSCAATYAGYLVANGELAALPVGSSLDPTGTFYWHPGTAFFGTYQLLFVRTSCDRSQQRIPVVVTIR